MIGEGLEERKDKSAKQLCTRYYERRQRLAPFTESAKPRIVVRVQTWERDVARVKSCARWPAGVQESSVLLDYIVPLFLYIGFVSSLASSSAPCPLSTLHIAETRKRPSWRFAPIGPEPRGPTHAIPFPAGLTSSLSRGLGEWSGMDVPVDRDSKDCATGAIDGVGQLMIM